MRKLAIIGIAFIALLASTANAEGERLRIVMLGDSLTAGYGLPEGESLPDHLEERLSAQGLNVEIINAGVPGNTIGDGLARYQTSVRAKAPDMIIIALGANDYLEQVSPYKSRQQMMSLLSLATADAYQPILIGLQRDSLEHPSPKEAAFMQIIPELAALYEAPVYADMMDGIAGNAAMYQADGLHPNLDGTEIIADRIAAFLVPYIKAEATTH